MKKKDCWVSVIIQLNSVSLVEQRFDIKCIFSVFWIDNKISKSDLDKMDLFREGAVNIGYELPLDPSNIFKNASFIEHIEPPSIQFYDKSKNVIMLKMVLNASLHEHFELDEFPFDSQFLNIKILYNIMHYSVLQIFPKEWIKTIETGGSGHYDRALQVAKMDSITNWEMLEPWFDFRSTRNRLPYTRSSKDEHDYYRFKFALIRLRLQRLPNFFFQQIIIPLFMIVSCSFATFSMDPDEWVGDRLGMYSICYLYNLSNI